MASRSINLGTWCDRKGKDYNRGADARRRRVGGNPLYFPFCDLLEGLVDGTDEFRTSYLGLA